MPSSRAGLLGLIAAGLFLAALASRIGTLAWLALLFAIYLGAGLARAPVASGIRVRAKRTCSEASRTEASKAEASIEVAVSLRNEGATRIYATFVDALPPGLRVAEGATLLRVALGRGEAVELRYRCEARRGRYRWDGIRASVGDPLGLFETEVFLPAEVQLLVRPRARRMPPVALRLEKTLSSPGSVPIRLGGSGTDFWGIREYRPGDPLKRLYWRLNARNPLRRYTKEFILERTAEIILVLDGRERMDISAGGASLFERELETAASLAAMLLRQGQRVGLFISGTSPRNVFPDYGKIQLHRILDCLAEAAPQGEGKAASQQFLPTLRYSRSAYMVFLSPLAEGDESAFVRLRALGYQALLVSPDALDFARSELADDEATRMAVRAWRIERKIALERVSSLGFPVIDWRTDRDVAPLIKAALERRVATRGR